MYEPNIGDRVWEPAWLMPDGRKVIVQSVFTVEDCSSQENGLCLSMGCHFRDIRWADTGRPADLCPELQASLAFAEDLAGVAPGGDRIDNPLFLIKEREPIFVTP